MEEKMDKIRERRKDRERGLQANSPLERHSIEIIGFPCICLHLDEITISGVNEAWQAVVTYKYEALDDTSHQPGDWDRTARVI